jgi:hypothetical protein
MPVRLQTGYALETTALIIPGLIGACTRVKRFRVPPSLCAGDRQKICYEWQWLLDLSGADGAMVRCVRPEPLPEETHAYAASAAVASGWPESRHVACLAWPDNTSVHVARDPALRWPQLVPSARRMKGLRPSAEAGCAERDHPRDTENEEARRQTGGEGTNPRWR